MEATMTNEQLNILCGEKIMGWKWNDVYKWKDWNPCEDISDAFMLVYKIINSDKRIQFDVEYDEGAWLASFWIHSQPDDEDMPLNVAEQADTAPLAIVKACLKAVE